MSEQEQTPETDETPAEEQPTDEPATPEPRPAKPPAAMDVSPHSQKPGDVVIGPVFDLETGRQVEGQEEE